MNLSVFALIFASLAIGAMSKGFFSSCNDGCNHCIDGHCSECVETEYVLYQGTCYSCPDRCDKCIVTKADSTAVQIDCIGSCQGGGCSSCNSDHTCGQCKSGYVLDKGRCFACETSCSKCSINWINSESYTTTCQDFSLGSNDDTSSGEATDNPQSSNQTTEDTGDIGDSGNTGSNGNSEGPENPGSTGNTEDSENVGNTGNNGDLGNNEDAGDTEDPKNAGNTGSNGNSEGPENPGSIGNTGDPENAGNTGSNGDSVGPENPGSTGNIEDLENGGNTGNNEDAGNTGDLENGGNTGNNGNQGNNEVTGDTGGPPLNNSEPPKDNSNNSGNYMVLTIIGVIIIITVIVSCILFKQYTSGKERSKKRHDLGIALGAIGDDDARSRENSIHPTNSSLVL